MLKWNEPDFISFFGVLPTSDEDALSHSFEIERDGLRLLVTIFAFEYAVYVSLSHNELPKPVITIRIPNCTHAHIASSHDVAPCFEAGATKHPITDMGIPPLLTRGIRIFIEPQFHLELIQPAGY